MPTALLDFLELNALRNPNRTCLVIGEAELSWAQLDGLVRDFAPRLLPYLPDAMAHRVAIRIADPLGFLCAFLGAISVGAAAIPLPERIRPDSLARILNDSRTDLVVADAHHLDAMRAVCQDCPVIVYPALEGAPRSARKHQPHPTARHHTWPDLEATLLYSSGTTTEPKGVIHTHLARRVAAARMARHFHMSDESRTLITAPIYTARALSPLLATWLIGGTAIVVDTFDTRSFIQLVTTQRPTTLDLVPTQFLMLLADARFSPEVFSSCQYVLCTGSALDRSLAEDLFTLFPDSFVEGYGSTETDHVACLQPRVSAEKHGSVGLPADDLQLLILDERDATAPAGVVGEIVVSSAANLLSYVNPRVAPNAFLHFQGKRYFRTGDLGRLDEDGYLWLAGRKKDMIITAGFNVYPTDIEAALLQHADVAEAAVVGLPHEVLGETPLAFVVLRTADDGPAVEARICSWVNARLSKNQTLYAVRAIDSIPRNASGKPLKEQLRLTLAHPGSPRPGLRP